MKKPRMNNQQSTSPKKIRPRCYVKSPTAQEMFRSIPSLISCAGVTMYAGKYMEFYKKTQSCILFMV